MVAKFVVWKSLKAKIDKMTHSLMRYTESCLRHFVSVFWLGSFQDACSVFCARQSNKLTDQAANLNTQILVIVGKSSTLFRVSTKLVGLGTPLSLGDHRATLDTSRPPEQVTFSVRLLFIWIGMWFMKSLIVYRDKYHFVRNIFTALFLMLILMISSLLWFSGVKMISSCCCDVFILVFSNPLSTL